MYFLIADETNTDESSEIVFFIYGGLIFHQNLFQDLHYGIREIRERAGFHPTDTYKHTSNCRPSHVSVEDFNKSKENVINLISESGRKFIFYLTHHGILKDKNLEKTYSNALNTVLSRYNIFLEKNREYGISLIDNLPISSKEKVLRDKFQRGLSFPNGKTVNLEHVYLYGSITDNTSHISSGMDIVLGTFRYWVNKLFELDFKDIKNLEENNAKLCHELMSKIIPLADLGFKFKNESYNHLAGMIIRPKEIKSDAIEADYYSLCQFLKNFV